MKKIQIIIFTLFIISINVKHIVAQQSKSDSLLKVVDSEKIDSNKVKFLFLISEEFISTGKFDESRKYANQALELSIKNKYDVGISQAYNLLGRNYMTEGNFPEALTNYYNALKIFDQLNDKIGIAKMWNNIGLIYMGQGKYIEALENYNKTLVIMLEMKINRGIAISYNNIGLINERLKKYDEALESYLKCIEIMEKDNDLYSIAAIKGNIGNVYYSKGDSLLSINKPEALQCLEKSLVEYKKSLEIRIKINDPYGIAQCNVNIGRSLLKLGKLNEAKPYLERGIEISKQYNLKEGLKEGYESLYVLNLSKTDYKEAFKNYSQFIAYRDSLQNEENTKKSFQIELQYEFDKKITADSIKTSEEKKIINAKLEYQKKEKYALYIGLLMVLIFLAFIFNRYKVTQKQKEVITIKEQETQRQKTEIEAQKHLVEEKNHEITQSIQYAQKIQKALLPSESDFQKIFTNSFILFKPKDIVSGDYYWISDKETHVFYATADCTGHGVPGGFMSMLGTALLNEIIDERGVQNCGEVLTLMREKIMQALKQAGESESKSKDGMDMVLIRIDKKTLEMQYAAANNSMYIVGSKQSAIGNDYCILQTANCKLYELPCDKMPVGVYHSEVKPFQTFNYQLQKGDIIYTYTDGYADQFGGEKGKKYTYKRLREKLLTINQEPLAEQRMSLEREFESWKNGVEQIDDVCLIGVRV